MFCWRRETSAVPQSGLTCRNSAVSGALKRLRGSFKDPLFVRAQQGMRPTPFALGLIAPLKSVLQDIDTIFATTEFDVETADITFAVAATDYAQTTFLAPLMSNVNRFAPNIRFSVVSTDGRRLPEQLDRQEIDFAVTVPEMAPRGAPYAELFEDRYVCAIDASHPLAETAQTQSILQTRPRFGYPVERWVLRPHR